VSTDLSQTLVVGISSTALFDLAEIDRRFWTGVAADPEAAMREYRAHMVATEAEPLPWGTGYPLVRALLALNQYQKPGEPPLTEVVVISHNSPETGLRVLNTIRRAELGITRSAFTGGEPVMPYLSAFDVSLFLTTNVEDAQQVANHEVCAVAVLYEPPEGMDQLPADQVRIALDGDAVLFHEANERTYQQHGLGAFIAEQLAHEDEPLAEGPYAGFLKKLAALQARMPMGVEYSPVRLALVTARSSPTDIRVIKTLRQWGVYVDAAFFLGGVSKARVLEAFRPHIFFDDQEVHLEPARGLVPAGKVPGRADPEHAEQRHDQSS